MWNTKSKGSTDITMCEGDYGVGLPFVVSGITIDAADSVLLSIKTTKNGEPILEKTFTNISGNTIDLSFTRNETEELTVGSYLYSMDWYKNGVFMYNLVNNGKLKVIDKI